MHGETVKFENCTFGTHLKLLESCYNQEEFSYNIFNSAIP